MTSLRFLIRTVLFVFLFVALYACESTITTHGRLVEQGDLNKLELGRTTKFETISILGNPSFDGAFGSERLYYNSQKMEQKVAGATSTIERQLLVLGFDENNVLQDLEIRDKTTDKEIIKLEATTPTPGDNLTIVDQIFSNLRRSNLQ